MKKNGPDVGMILGLVVLLFVVLVFVWIAIARPGFFQNFFSGL